MAQCSPQARQEDCGVESLFLLGTMTSCQLPTVLFGLCHLGWFEHQNSPTSSSRLGIYDKNPARFRRVPLGEGLALL